MKKRVKLFTTIASLCLAVALMAFGVYAATTANFTVSGSVNFTAAKDVYMYIDSVTVNTTSVLNSTNADDYTETVTIDSIGGTGDTTQKSWITYDETTNAPKYQEVDGAITDINYQFTNQTADDAAVYGYLVTITFNAGRDMTGLTATLNETPVVENVNYTQELDTTNIESGELKAGETVTLTILVSLKDVLASVEGVDVETVVAFARA